MMADDEQTAPEGVDMDASQRVNDATHALLEHLTRATRDHFEGMIVCVLITRIISTAAVRDLGNDEARRMGMEARELAMNADIEQILRNIVCVQGDAKGGEA
jgi:hypothetical protein